MKKSKKKRTGIRLEAIHCTGRSFGYTGPLRIYLDYGIPGELVDADNVFKEGNYLRGKVSSVLQHSQGRTTPFCRHFGLCGGCNWQHMEYDVQLHYKRQILADALHKYDIPVPEIPLPVPSPSLVNYRQKLDYTFSGRRWYHEGEGKVDRPQDRLALGFHPLDMPHKVLNVEECFLQPPPGRFIYREVLKYTLDNDYSYYDPKEKTGLMQSLSIRVNRNGEAMVGLIFRENDPNKIEGLLSHIQQVSPLVKSIWWAIHPDITASLNEDEYQFFNGTDPFLTEQANGLTFQISPGSFYQPNPAQAGKIFSQIPALADLSGKETVYDLYSGIGTLGLSVASGAGRVIGIEGSGSAVKDAIDNTRINGFTNSSFIRGDVLETFTPEFVEQHGKPDLVILDPPRSGTLIEIKKTILHAAPPKIIYLSCNPLSLARDLKMLTQAYQITSIQPFDQFPHTHHLETLVTLRLRSA